MEINEIALKRLIELRNVYDKSLNVCDPLDFAIRQRNLLQSIAEFLIYPLQEHEMALRSQLRNDNETKSS